MDLVEIRKKARQQQPDAKTEGEPAAPLPVVAEEPVQFPDAVPIPEPEVVEPTESMLKKFFPDLDLATEEDYIQGISGQDRSVEQDTQQWLTFMLGKEEYALALDVVLELIKPRPYTDLPKVPGYVKGILSLRGEVVPVIDLRIRLKLAENQERGGVQRIIVCEGKEQSIGILVDKITQVVRLSEDDIESAPLVLNEGEKDFVSGVGRYRGRMLILLNPEVILQI